MPAAARRDQLLDAALQIIARDGYGAVSIDAIAREIDVTRPVVYNVFDRLDSLLYALLDRQEQRALDQLVATIPAGPDLRNLPAFVARTVEQFVTMVTSDPLTWRLIFLAFDGTPAAVRERVDRDREVIRHRIRALVELALVSQGADPAIDADVISHAVVATGEYFGRLILEHPDAVDSDRLAGTVTGLIAALRP